MPAEIRCPKCSSASNELMDCDNCQDIGCNRCMRRNQGRWIHFNCGKQGLLQQDFSNVLSSMFG